MCYILPEKATLLWDSVTSAPLSPTQAPPDPREGMSPLSPGRLRRWKGLAAGPAPGWAPPVQGAGERWQPPPRRLLHSMCPELGERQFQEACFEALTSKKRKCLLNKR